MSGLIKITYDGMENFLAQLNKNFATIETSPLFKGIPGKDAIGQQGPQGLRGTKFIFCLLPNFMTIFPTEIKNSSSINIDFINNKIVTFTGKQNILKALNVTNFVDGDIVVLTNSMMLSYDFANNKFIDTKQAFNQSTNIASTIEKKIEDYVSWYVDNNVKVNSNISLWNKFKTYAKNYADTNNTDIIADITSSIYVPLYPPLTNSTGTLIENHNYYGYVDEMFQKASNGTTIFGSMAKYIDLLFNTTSTSQPNTFNNEYAPNPSNIPSAVFLQDTYKNGIMFGRKNAENLKSFGSIYKDEDDNFILKSHQGVQTADFSLLKLGKELMAFNKSALIGKNLTIGSNIEIGGDINSIVLKTNTFTVFDKKYGYASAVDTAIELGARTTSHLFLNSSYITIPQLADVEYEGFDANAVFVTDSFGTLNPYYKLEKRVIDNAWLAFETKFPTTETIDKLPYQSSKFITSDYYLKLLKKFNSTTDYVLNNYYSKNDWTQADDVKTITGLRLKNLDILNNINVKYGITKNTNVTKHLFNIDKVNATIQIGSDAFMDENDQIKSPSSTNIDGVVTFGTIPHQINDEFNKFNLFLFSELPNYTIISGFKITVVDIAQQIINISPGWLIYNGKPVYCAGATNYVCFYYAGSPGRLVGFYHYNIETNTINIIDYGTPDIPNVIEFRVDYPFHNRRINLTNKLYHDFYDEFTTTHGSGQGGADTYVKFYAYGNILRVTGFVTIAYTIQTQNISVCQCDFIQSTQSRKILHMFTGYNAFDGQYYGVFSINESGTMTLEYRNHTESRTLSFCTEFVFNQNDPITK